MGAQIWRPNRQRFSLFNNVSAAEAVQSSLPRTTGTGTWDSGSDGWSKMGRVVQWDGQAASDVWGTQTVVEGCDGTQVEPALAGYDASSLPSDLSVWLSEALRPMTMSYLKDMVRYGVNSRRYLLSNLARYEQHSDSNTPLNLIDLRLASNGLPLYLGFPHFQNGMISTIRDGVSGLQTVAANEYDSILDIEPITGMVVNRRTKFQYTLKVERTSIWHTNILVPHCTAEPSCALYLPLYWRSEEGAISFGEARKFKKEFYEAFALKKKIPTGCFFIGTLAIGGSFVSAVQGMRVVAQAGQQVLPSQQAIESAKLMSVIP